jgi:hypothetical protein
MVRADRAAHPEAGLSNLENLGFVPIETLLLWSEDAGHTWGQPEPLVSPLVGPSFELCCLIVPLHDGHWFLSTSTWRIRAGEHLRDINDVIMDTFRVRVALMVGSAAGLLIAGVARFIIKL